MMSQTILSNSVPLTSGYPPVINLELSSNCNLSCIMCYRRVRKGGDGHISVRVAQSVIAQAALMNALVKCYWRGEPLLHPHIKEILASASSARANIALVTNGTVLTAGISRSICESTVSKVTVSLDAHFQHTLETVRPGGVLSSIQNNLHQLLRIRGKRKTPVIGITYVLLDVNKDELKECERYWAEQVDFFEVAYYNNPLGRGSELLHNAPPISRSECDKCPYSCKASHRELCTQMQTKLFVSWRGEVYPCCMAFDEPESLRLGSVLDSSIEEIWRSDRRATLIMDTLRGEIITPCCDCSMKYNC
jgi:radical SAM protein with 4Fe4S-binding SPASM domain